MGPNHKGEIPLHVKFMAGAASGAVGAGLSTPADLVKVRQQASTVATPTTRAALCEIYNREGVKGLFRGTVPTMQRAAILTATQLGTYDHAKHFVRDELQLLDEGPLLHFTSGTVAGFFVAVTTSPV